MVGGQNTRIGGQNTMGKGNQNTMCKWVNIPWTGVKIQWVVASSGDKTPWVNGSSYHG